MSEQTQVLVIGGGAAGMMAAITAAERGRQVLLLEGNDRVGKKLLATGNGKCNFTNLRIDTACYHGDHERFVSHVLDRFSSADLRGWFRRIGIEETITDGRVYPRSEQAASVLDALRLRMEALGVRVITNAKVMSVKAEKEGYHTQTAGENYRSETIVLAAGSSASPKTGSDGSGYRLAEQLGLTVREPLPALTHLKLDGSFTKSWAGVRCDGTIALYTDGIMLGQSAGQLQLTAYGVSGIPAFEVSRYASRALADGRSVEARLCFLPDAEEKIGAFLRDRREIMADYPVPQFLNGLLPKNLAGVLLRLSEAERKKNGADLTDDELSALARCLISLRVPVTGTGGFEQAQVATGGVTPDAIDQETMESVKSAGCYVAGELMDIDGICGGYNLHWAFATGHLAGLHA